MSVESLRSYGLFGEFSEFHESALRHRLVMNKASFNRSAQGVFCFCTSASVLVVNFRSGRTCKTQCQHGGPSYVTYTCT